MAATLTQLLARARARGDSENDPNITDPTLTTWINEGYLELWDIVAAAFADHFHSTADFTLVGGTVSAAQFALPAAFYQLRAVEKNPATTSRYLLPTFSIGEKDGLELVSYRLLGGVLQVEPYELAAGNYRLYYVPAPTLLAAGSDAVDARVAPWEEYISISAAIKGRVRQETGTEDLQLALTLVQRRIEAMAATRDAGASKRTRDVYATGPNWPYRWWLP